MDSPWHHSHLPPETWALFQNLSNSPLLKKEGFALAGGTNLAMRFGHRLSVDLDFFTASRFDKEVLRQGLLKLYPELLITNETRQSLQTRVEGVKVEFFLHDYPLLEKHEEQDGLRLYALPDVAAMKLNALNNRGAKKDFYDVAELLLRCPVEKLLDWFGRKYRNTDRMSLVRSLAYFEDAEHDPEPLRSTRSWAEVKQCLGEAQTKLIQNL